MEPGEKDVMDRLPRPKGHLLTSARWARMLFQALLITGATLIMFRMGLKTSPEVAQTAALTTLAFSQLFQALNSRSETHSIFSKELTPNYTLYWTIVASLLIQLIVVYTGFGHTFLKTVSISGTYLVFSFLLALIPVVGTEFYKIARNEKAG